MRIAFYYDVVCPYAWMGSTRIEALAARHGATVDWKPILLGGVFKSIAAPQVPAGSWSGARQRMIARDLVRQADRFGLSIQFPAGHPRRSVEAMRLIVSAPEATRPALSHALYDAYWGQGRDLADRSVLAEVAGRFELTLDRIDDPDIKAELRARTDEAVALGVFGVPAMVVGDRFWWGADRLDLVEAALGGPATRADVPAVEHPKRPQTIRFHYDFSSPFAYLGWTQVNRVAAAHGATVEPVPILLGALFNSIGTPNVPIAAMSPPKARYYARDLHDYAAWWGVPFSFSSHFPLRTVTALRVAIQDPRAIEPLFHATWAQDRNIADPAVLAAVLTEAGLDAAALIQGTQDPAVKAQLRANTERAQQIGVPGVPTFELDDGLLIWGQDRFPMLHDALQGWRPPDHAA